MINAKILRLIAAIVGCAAIGGSAQAQLDLFHRQPAQSAQMTPPADIPADAAADAGGAPEQVLRINRLEEQLRQANGRIEELSPRHTAIS